MFYPLFLQCLYLFIFCFSHFSFASLTYTTGTYINLFLLEAALQIGRFILNQVESWSVSLLPLRIIQDRSESPSFGPFICVVAHRLLIKKIHLFRVTAWFFIKNKLPAFGEDIWASRVPLMTIFPASSARLGSPCLSPRVPGPGRTMRVTVK